MSEKHHPLAGPTGRFPEGKQNAEDEGELRVAIATDVPNNVVRMDFGKPVKWLSIGPDAARQLALLLLRKAGDLDGKITEVRTP